MESVLLKVLELIKHFLGIPFLEQVQCWFICIAVIIKARTAVTVNVGNVGMWNRNVNKDSIMN